MKAHVALFVAVGNLLTAILAIAWAYVSYRYNLLNVGGGTGDVNFWYDASNVAYFALAVWWLTLIAGWIGGVAFRISKIRVISYVSVSAFLGPALFLGLSWWLHRDFPPCNC